MAGRAAYVIAFLLALAGCGLGATEPTVHPGWEGCPAVQGDSQDGLDLPPLADDFHPVAAMICGPHIERRSGGGQELLAVESRADDVTALVQSLRLPSEKRTNGSCTMELVSVPYLALLDEQGRWVRPGIPADVCGKPRVEFRTAFEQLETVRVSSRVTKQLESDEAARTGCSQSHSDMVWVSGRFGVSGGTTELPPADAVVGLCRYAVPVAERGNEKPSGDFQSGGPLPPATWAAVRAELATAAPATGCTTPASRFALLHPPAGQIYVEGDGCRRVLLETGPGSALRQATPKLIELLF
jgi:hypothetical protein